MPLRPITLFRFILGLAAWSAAGWIVVRLATSGNGGSLARLVEDFATSEPMDLFVTFRSKEPIGVGDRLHLERGDEWEPEAIGEVVALYSDEGVPLESRSALTRRVGLRIWDVRRTGPPRTEARIRLLEVPPLAASWAFETLLPPEILERAREEFETMWLRERSEIIARARPIVDAALREVQLAVSRETEPFFRRHRREIEALVRRVESGIGHRRLAALFEDPVWPILRANFQPVTDELGAAAWERLPLWSLGWRWAFEALPFTRDDHFERRWKRFVDRDLVPLVKSWAPRFLEAAREASRETIADPQVRALLHDIALGIGGDREFHRLLGVYVREVFQENEVFIARLRALWESRQTQETVAHVSGRIEETVRHVSELVLGTEETGISPGFAQVLRAQILQKGRAVFVISLGDPHGVIKPSGAEFEATVEYQRRGVIDGEP